MKQKRERKSKTLAVYVTPTELAALKERYAQTTHRIFAEFIRAILQQQPVIKKVRNQSLDDVHLSLIGIKNQLEIAQRSFTAAVESLKDHPPGPIAQQTIEFLLAEEYTLAQRTTETKALLIQLYAKCSQDQNLSKK
jgi:hypothetical protein